MMLKLLSLRVLKILVLTALLVAVAATAAVAAAPTLNIGDYVYFGKYEGNPILWRVIHKDTNGDPILFSDRILSLKAFDAYGQYHPYNSDSALYGNNYYPDSNIRQWLNSSEAVIDWMQNDPQIENITNGLNPYSTEKGFLANGNFTGSERFLIQPYSHKVVVSSSNQHRKDGGTTFHLNAENIEDSIQNYDTTAYYKQVTDSVFLLSVKQLKEWVFDNRAILGDGYHMAKPTPHVAATAGYSSFNNLLKMNSQSNWFYWLNTPYGMNVASVRYVSMYGDIVGGIGASTGDRGIRPALHLKSSLANFQAGGNGSESSPYTITGANVYDPGSAESAPAATNITGNSLQLTWNMLIGYTDATQYEVFQNGVLKGTVSAPNRSFQVTGLQSGTTYSFTFKAVKSSGTRSPSSGALSVKTKSAPTGISISTTNVPETFGFYQTIATLSAADVDAGDTFSYSLVNIWGSNDNEYFSIDGNQLVNEYPLDYESKSSYFIRVRVTDGYGLFYDQSFTITLTNVDDPPQAVSLAYFTLEDGLVSGQLAGTDADSTTLTYSVVQSPSIGTVTLTNATSGTFDYTPNPNAHGSDSFTFKVFDGTSYSNIATVSVLVQSVNDRPVVNGQSIVINEDQVYQGVLAANDSDGPQLLISVMNQPTRGKVTITNGFTGAFTYQPNANASGIDSFTFSAYDGIAYALVNATVYIQILSVDDIPSLNSAGPFGGATPLQERWISYNDLLAATGAADPDATQPLVFAVVETSAGTVSKNGDTPTSLPYLTIGPGETLIWMPSMAESGKTVAGFSLKVFDGAIGSTTAVPISFTVADVTAPAKPGPITESDVGMYSVKLTWPATSDNVGVTKYELYKNAQLLTTITPTADAVFGSADVVYEVTGLDSDMVYTFFIRAVDAAGNASEFSQALYTLTLPPPDYEAPSAPGNLAASGWNVDSFTLTWTAATDNVMVTNYKVYMDGVLLPAQWPIPGVPNNPFPPLYYQVSNMPENKQVTFRVTAIDRAANESVLSAPLTVTYVPRDITAPTVPSGLVSSNITTGGFRVSWAAATDSIGVTGYNVYRNGAYAATVGGTITSYTFSGLTANTTYQITVMAYDAAKNKSAQSTALSVKTLSAATGPDTQAPSVPSGLVSSNITTGGFRVSWAAATDNLGVTGYNVYRNGAYVATVGGTITTYTFSGLTANTTYSIAVMAYDLAKNRSAQSTALSVNTLSAVTGPDTQAPSVPSGLVSSNVTTGGFTVSWTAATDNLAVTGYNVYRNGAYVATVGGTITSYTFSGLTANTTYSITVMAYDAAKNKSVQSTALSVKTSSAVTGPDTQAPSVPSGVTASGVSKSGFTMTWTAATDNVGVKSYNVYRNGAYVATIGTTSYMFTGLTAATAYQIRVMAIDAAGNRSAQSAAVTVTTLSH